ncbi:hypothetical protein N7532_010097 [Penicillium argentinense]|uniref:Uncharacterized protein n=1 Tax=Penicillium argentinense TaxID=1131581 RepID=A0A9W9EP12_9EURO|nr:uncharacterized protein N7532_010097 [Penicillium argentinense]KAJ5085326.1 hypothetical protein N7532_010097 [Penicillium argentinense]
MRQRHKYKWRAIGHPSFLRACSGRPSPNGHRSEVRGDNAGRAVVCRAGLPFIFPARQVEAPKWILERPSPGTRSRQPTASAERGRGPGGGGQCGRAKPAWRRIGPTGPRRPKPKQGQSQATEKDAASVAREAHGPPFTGSDRMQVLGCSAQTGSEGSRGGATTYRKWIPAIRQRKAQAKWQWNGVFRVPRAPVLQPPDQMMGPRERRVDRRSSGSPK